MTNIKTILTLAIAMILMCGIAISALEKDSAEYVISILSIIINILLIGFMFFRATIKKVKNNKSI